MVDVSRQYLRTAPETDSAVQAVLAGGRYILGENVKAFEGEMAAYLGCSHAVGAGHPPRAASDVEDPLVGLESTGLDEDLQEHVAQGVEVLASRLQVA